VTRKVSLERVNHYLLSKQHLSRSSRSSNVLEVVNDLLGLHATYPQTPYLSLLARMKRFTKEMLDIELYKKRTLARIRGMRGTLFIVPRKSIALVHKATRADFDFQEYLNQWGIPQGEFQTLANSIIHALEESSMTIHELKRVVSSMLHTSPFCIRRVKRQQGRTVYTRSNLSVTLTVLEAEGLIYSYKDPSQLEKEGKSITDAPGVNTYALLKKDFPEVDLQRYTVEEARSLLVQKYLAAYGPLTLKDMAWWLSLKQKQIEEALCPFMKELVELEIPEIGKGFWMLKEDFERLQSFEPLKERQAALLPYEDMYLKGYKIRRRLVARDHEKKVYPGGSALPSVMLDGRIVGVWKISTHSEKKQEMELQINLFHRIDEEAKWLILKEAQLVQNLFGFKGSFKVGIA
jgi:DNA-binding transcriptional ArsR family regulator